MLHRLKRLMTLSLATALLLQQPLTQAVAFAQPAVVSDEVLGAEDGNVSDEQTGSVSGNTPDDSQQTESDEVKQETLLNYIYIQEVSQQSQTDGNVIVASFGQTGEVFSDVCLHLVDTKNGHSYVLCAAKNEDTAYEFLTKDANLPKGIYRVAQISAQSADGQVVLAMDEIPGMEQVVFGVEEAPAIDADRLVDLEMLAGDLEAQTFAQTEFADLTNLVSIDVTDLSGASDSIAKELSAARAEVSDGALEAQRVGESDEAVVAERAAGGNVVIFLDPGHDATHAGARAGGINEEDITLKVAQYCKDYLTSTYTNVTVYMSRSTAACPHPGLSSGDDNSARVADAKSVNADAYVSIHFNSAGASLSGAMVFYPNSNYNSTVGAAGQQLATQIQTQLVKLGLTNNGIRIRNSESGDTYEDGSLADYYGVIRGAKKVGIPAVIVEHAFLTNASDAAFLKSEENLKKLGEADAIGIANAFSLSTEPIEFEADDPEVTEINGVKGTFQLNLTGVKPAASVNQVKFKVYPVGDSSLAYYYVAQVDDAEAGSFFAEGDIANHGSTYGQYKVIAYAYDAAGTRTQLSSTTFTIEEGESDAADTKLLIKRTTSQKKVSVTLKGYSSAAEVSFKVYSNKLGIRKAKTYKAEKKSGGWAATFAITDFKAMGEYTVVAYSKSSYGKTTKVCRGSFTIDGPSLKSVTASNINLDKGTFRLKANRVQSASGIKQVQFKVKNLEGKRVTKTYTAKSRSSYYYVDLNFKDFGYQLGKYQIIVIADDGNGISEQISKSTYVFEKPTPQIKAKLVARETKLNLSAKDLGIGVNIKGVRFAIWHAAGDVKRKYYEAKNKNGTWSASVKVADLAKSGTYKIQAYVKGLNGKYTKVGKVQRVTVSGVQGGSVTTKERAAGGMYLYVGSISANSVVSKVEITAWPTAKSSAKFTYTAKERANETYRALIDPKNHKDLGGTYRYHVTVTLKNGVSEKLLTGRFIMDGDEDDGDSDDDFENEDGYHTITGSNGVTVAQMMAYYQANASYPAYYAASDAPTLKKFCTIYYNECKAENIRVEVAFVQAMKETNFLRYTGDVEIQQYNFAGIGATGGGAKGNSFSTVTLGIRAHIQHLKAYANSEPLTKACADPRFSYVTRGTAPYVEWLGIPDNPYGKGWATAQNYGSSILQMIAKLKSY